MPDKKKIDPKQIVYVNYRCRRCGGYISKEIYMKYLGYRLNERGRYGLNTSVFHSNCPEKIEQEEHVLFDLISWSEQPISDAVDIVKMSEKEKENE